jgi:hypothetical protein
VRNQRTYTGSVTIRDDGVPLICLELLTTISDDEVDTDLFDVEFDACGRFRALFPDMDSIDSIGLPCAPCTFVLECYASWSPPSGMFMDDGETIIDIDIGQLQVLGRPVSRTWDALPEDIRYAVMSDSEV